MSERREITMRAPCPKCGCVTGYVERKANNDIVRCTGCDAFCYCAPRAELGLPSEAPKPIKIQSKYSGRCLHCGDRYAVGDTVWWTRGVRGAQCLECGGKA
jgi:transcription elongation factor Elf1